MSRSTRESIDMSNTSVPFARALATQSEARIVQQGACRTQGWVQAIATETRQVMGAELPGKVSHSGLHIELPSGKAFDIDLLVSFDTFQCCELQLLGQKNFRGLQPFEFAHQMVERSFRNTELACGQIEPRQSKR